LFGGSNAIRAHLGQTAEGMQAMVKILTDTRSEMCGMKAIPEEINLGTKQAYECARTSRIDPKGWQIRLKIAARKKPRTFSFHPG